MSNLFFGKKNKNPPKTIRSLEIRKPIKLKSIDLCNLERIRITIK